MKLPRAVSGAALAKSLQKFGYRATRQTGSHIRLARDTPDHHDYFRNNPDAPYCQYVISPKVAKFRKKHGKLLKKPEQE